MTPMAAQSAVITKHTLKNRLLPNTAANHSLMGAALLIPECSGRE
jgi:hypothetical protein